MSHELHYTSAPRGLNAGSRGFCTVARTQDLPGPLAERLESLSAYRPAFAPHDPNAARNPVVYSHTRLDAGGRSLSVVSRIGPAGLDYTERPNKYAHHVVLGPSERPEGGPAWLMLRPGFLDDRWDGDPRLLPAGRPVPRGDAPAGVAEAWRQATGDAGWAGVLAESYQAAPGRPVYLIYPPGLDLLPLFAEALNLLPPSVRWDVTFTTYLIGSPVTGVCSWRGVLQNTPEAQAALRLPDALRIDLTAPLGQAEDGPLVRAARTGEPPVSLASDLSESSAAFPGEGGPIPALPLGIPAIPAMPPSLATRLARPGSDSHLRDPQAETATPGGRPSKRRALRLLMVMIPIAALVVALLTGYLVKTGRKSRSSAGMSQNSKKKAEGSTKVAAVQSGSSQHMKTGEKSHGTAAKPQMLQASGDSASQTKGTTKKDEPASTSPPPKIANHQGGGSVPQPGDREAKPSSPKVAQNDRSNEKPAPRLKQVSERFKFIELSEPPKDSDNKPQQQREPLRLGLEEGFEPVSIRLAGFADKKWPGYQRLAVPKSGRVIEVTDKSGGTNSESRRVCSFSIENNDRVDFFWLDMGLEKKEFREFVRDCMLVVDGKGGLEQCFVLRGKPNDQEFSWSSSSFQQGQCAVPLKGLFANSKRVLNVSSMKVEALGSVQEAVRSKASNGVDARECTFDGASFGLRSYVEIQKDRKIRIIIKTKMFDIAKEKQKLLGLKRADESRGKIALAQSYGPDRFKTIEELKNIKEEINKIEKDINIYKIYSKAKIYIYINLNIDGFSIPLMQATNFSRDTHEKTPPPEEPKQ